MLWELKRVLQKLMCWLSSDERGWKQSSGSHTHLELLRFQEVRSHRVDNSWTTMRECK